MNPHFPVNTLLIMRGAVAAERLGVAEAYNEAMFAGMWEQGLKLDLPEVWHRALIDAELPADALAEAAGDDAIKQQLVSNTASAVERGAFGSPTFFLGQEMWFGKERLCDVEQAALEGTRI
jgi:2-hydroxychromene-2-carboxylate isomerase